MLGKFIQWLKGRTRKAEDLTLQGDFIVGQPSISIVPLSTSVHRGEKIQVSPMPQVFFEWLDGLGLVRPKMCWHNCFWAVIQGGSLGRIDLSYVLGWVTHESDGIPARHAWLKCGDKYYDPTLEPQGLLLGATHELAREFPLPELSKMLLDRFGKEHVQKMFGGVAAWWPLLMSGNGYEFADV